MIHGWEDFQQKVKTTPRKPTFLVGAPVVALIAHVRCRHLCAVLSEGLLEAYERARVKRNVVS
ncbi:hypothetical protein N9L31_00080 [bacterium]|nr:hypothetical protein [bacterium]